MSESFSVCKAAFGSQQASTEKRRICSSQTGEETAFSVVNCHYLHVAAPESALKLPTCVVVSPAGNRIGKEVRLDKSDRPSPWSQVEN